MPRGRPIVRGANRKGNSAATHYRIIAELKAACPAFQTCPPGFRINYTYNKHTKQLHIDTVSPKHVTKAAQDKQQALHAFMKWRFHTKMRMGHAQRHKRHFRNFYKVSYLAQLKEFARLCNPKAFGGKNTIHYAQYTNSGTIWPARVGANRKLDMSYDECQKYVGTASHHTT